MRVTMRSMNVLALPFSTSGRLASKPFAIGAVALYVAIVASQILLSTRGGLALFAVAQAVLTWIWYALHAKRLRDAGCPTGTALGIAVLYGISMVLLVLLAQLLSGVGGSGSNNPDSAWAPFIIVAFLIAMLSGEPNLGLFFHVALVILMMVFAPLAIALGYSVWAGTRPSAVIAS